MTLTQFAALAKVSYSTVKDWATLGKIEAIQVGSRWIIYEREWQRYKREGHLKVEREHNDN